MNKPITKEQLEYFLKHRKEKILITGKLPNRKTRRKYGKA